MYLEIRIHLYNNLSQIKIKLIVKVYKSIIVYNKKKKHYENKSN